MQARDGLAERCAQKSLLQCEIENQCNDGEQARRPSNRNIPDMEDLPCSRWPDFKCCTPGRKGFTVRAKNVCNHGNEHTEKDSIPKECQQTRPDDLGVPRDDLCFFC